MPQQGDKVVVEYRGKLDDGTLFASTKDQGQPLEFTIGAGIMLPDFEMAIMTLNPGDSISIHIPSAQAYGERDESLVITMPLTSLPNGEPLPVGAMLGIQGPDGDVMRVRVVEVRDDEVVLDCNHELAGEALNFDITLVDVLDEGDAVEREKHAAGCTCGCDRLQESLSASA